ncbi:unnamed protein product [Linum trigynum]|uniref:Uncharacterized protein n=1 Tax=Linum trigynum TaxID=586398 RepID=A0AAV2CFE8_9ROSI
MSQSGSGAVVDDMERGKGRAPDVIAELEKHFSPDPLREQEKTSAHGKKETSAKKKAPLAAEEVPTQNEPVTAGTGLITKT